MFTLAIPCLTTSNLPWFMDLTIQVPMQYCSLQHRTTSITSHIHNWVLFLLWLCLFILSEFISPLISSSILDTHWPGEFIFQCPIIFPFHTVHRVLKAKVLKWFAIPFSGGPHFLNCPIGCGKKQKQDFTELLSEVLQIQQATLRSERNSASNVDTWLAE